MGATPLSGVRLGYQRGFTLIELMIVVRRA